MEFLLALIPGRSHQPYGAVNGELHRQWHYNRSSWRNQAI